MSVVKITKDNFESEVLNSATPVLIDFWASWCMPCRMIAPVVEEISEEQDNIKIGKVNVDEEGTLAEKYGVMSIPTLILFKDGKPQSTIVGLQSKDAIMKKIGAAT